MDIKIILLMLCFLTMDAAGAKETFARLPGESAVDFVNRIAPLPSTVKHAPIEYRDTATRTPLIFAFLEYPPSVDDAAGATTLRAVAFLPISDATYEKISIDSYESEGGNPDVESVFFQALIRRWIKR